MLNLPDDAGRINLAIIVLIIVLIMFSVIIMGFFHFTATESAQSVYIYELKFSTSEPIDNVTLLIPVPSYYNPETGQNETVINMSSVSFKNVDHAGSISTKIEPVNGVPMLNISADRITPLYKNRIEPIAILPGQNESELPQPTHIYSDSYSEETPLLIELELHMYDSDAGHEIDTKSPVGNEPLFMPYRIQVNFHGAEGGMYDGSYLSEGDAGSFIEVPFILSYTADDHNVLTISTEFQGINQWWVGGWQSNSYHERISHEFTGEANGTYWVKGVLVTGDGVY
ncbi:hypothetical protein [Methanogenium organophilum]|uniref:Uncharacterized protein n=1 Tax=Methanogenium organophilum TaxID=2199 RepID=A0A9X9S596_METOG|nr:hypothetical protein [Methanogenium organophilum]WAI01747.1 hypothetical protein OU421_02415 [Methanogenium organophilum]